MAGNKHTTIPAIDPHTVGGHSSSAWNPEQVGECLIAAYAILDRCPDSHGPRGHGNAWPTVVTDEQAVPEPDGSRVRCAPPSPRELTHMEAALDWLRILGQEDQVTAQMVSHWALTAARRHSVKILCQRHGWALATFYRKRMNGLAFLATHLNIKAIPVFHTRS